MARPTPPQLFLRALGRRCPACGGAELFRSWFRIEDRCPSCGLQTTRGEEGYLVGAYMFNIMAAELLWLAAFLVIVAATWPAPPWDWLLYGGGALMILAPLIGYPWARTLFLAFDLVFRPAWETEQPTGESEPQR